MSEWKIRIPHRDRSQPLDAAALDLPRALDGEDRQVARELLLTAALDPSMSTFGDLLDLLDGASADQRRAILDGARQRAGLPTASRIDFEARFAAVQPRRSRSTGARPQVCGASGCLNRPMNPDGSDAMSDARRWFCAEHRDQAAPADLEPTGPRLAYGPSGIVDVAAQEVEAERERHAEESRRRQREAAQDERRADAAERDALERARAEQQRREGAHQFGGSPP